MDDMVNNSGIWKAHPYIAPDESYIIYDAEVSNIPDNGDLFMSFNINGTWSKALSLGANINTEVSETTATVSPDGNYLFFNRGEEKTSEDGTIYWDTDLYWVDFVQLKKEILENRDND